MAKQIIMVFNLNERIEDHEATHIAESLLEYSKTFTEPFDITSAHYEIEEHGHNSRTKAQRSNG